MDDLRPRFLNLTQIKFPVTAIVSIAQRISGVFLFIGLPVVLYALSCSLNASESFNVIKNLILTSVTTKVFVWLYVSAILFHIIGGLRHLIMDIGFLENLAVAKVTAHITFAITFICIIILGAYLW